MENIILKLQKDVKAAADSLTSDEARFLVDFYYQMQNYRISAKNQCRSLDTEDPNEPHITIGYFAENFRLLENQIKNCLASYAKSKPIGQWCMSILGIGPVITAGLIAHIDIMKVQTAGQVQAFAGLDPTKKWEKGQKRPFNAKLKTLCWKIGESFIKVSNKDEDIYGHIYRVRKEYENDKNLRFEYKEQAEQILKEKKIGKDTEAYKFYSIGMLPPGHINARARRYAVKIFLSHLFSVWYEMEHHEKPPKPYAIAILGHAHKVPIPNWENGQLCIPEEGEGGKRFKDSKYTMVKQG